MRNLQCEWHYIAMDENTRLQNIALRSKAVLEGSIRDSSVYDGLPGKLSQLNRPLPTKFKFLIQTGR